MGHSEFEAQYAKSIWSEMSEEEKDLSNDWLTNRGWIKIMQWGYMDKPKIANSELLRYTHKQKNALLDLLIDGYNVQNLF